LKKVQSPAGFDPHAAIVDCPPIVANRRLLILPQFLRAHKVTIHGLLASSGSWVWRTMFERDWERRIIEGIGIDGGRNHYFPGSVVPPSSSADSQFFDSRFSFR
jgi:hypothetical protein